MQNMIFLGSIRRRSRTVRVRELDKLPPVFRNNLERNNATHTENATSEVYLVAQALISCISCRTTLPVNL